MSRQDAIAKLRSVGELERDASAQVEVVAEAAF